jgi:hypothetical protein
VCPADVNDGRPVRYPDTRDSTKCPSSALFSCTAVCNSTFPFNAAYSFRSPSSPHYFLLRGLTPATRRPAATDSSTLLFAPSTLCPVSLPVATGCKKLHCTKNPYCFLPAVALPHFAISPVHLTAGALQ